MCANLSLMLECLLEDTRPLISYNKSSLACDVRKNKNLVEGKKNTTQAYKYYFIHDVGPLLAKQQLGLSKPVVYIWSPYSPHLSATWLV